MRLIGGILKTFVLLALLGAAAYAFLGAFPFFKRSVPGAEPIPYILGTFDTEFNISKSYFISALSEAEAIWEKPYGKNLFVYEPEDSGKRTLKVNLVYDYRQQATNKLKSLGIVVEDNKASYDSLKSKYTELKKEYESEKSAFNARVEAFNQRKKAYEAEVKSSNDKGGASPQEYKRLEAKRLLLNAEAGAISH